MTSKKSGGARVSDLEERQKILEDHLGKLEREEQILSDKLKSLEEEEVKLAMKISNLSQVKKRRPDFLVDYVKSKNKPSEREPDKPKEEEIEKLHKKKAEDTVTDVLESHEAEEFDPPKKEKLKRGTKKILGDVLASPSEASPPPEDFIPKRGGNAKRVLDSLLSSKTKSEAPEIIQPDQRDFGSDRKNLHAAQIQNVLKKKEVNETAAEENKKPVTELSVGAKSSESVLLFRLLLSKGVMSIDEAAKFLSKDKKVVGSWARELESNGIIEVSKPLYGSPTLKLKTLSEKMQKVLKPS